MKAKYFLLILFLSACAAKPEPLQIGKDNCDFCKMTLSDDRFGAELVTSKGKVFRFDDIACMLKFYQSKRETNFELKLVTDFSNPSKGLINAETALYLQSENLRAPMNGQIAAFEKSDDVKAAFEKLGGKNLNWQELLSQ